MPNATTMVSRPKPSRRATRRGRHCLCLGIALAVAASSSGEASGRPAQTGPAATPAVLLEDHPEPLLAQLQGQDGGQSVVETRDIFSGSSSVKIIPMQRFRRDVAGWAFPIRARPGPGEYRYLRFAWRADGARGIMLQLHDQRDWNIRYTAGLDEPNWGSRFVAPRPPAKWTLVTCDLHADFGDREIHGIALTVFGGAAGYFDHIYLGRSVEDLDRIDATGLADPGASPPQPTDDDLDRFWSDLGGDDGARAYSAFWTMVHAPRRAVPFLREVLSPPRAPQDAVAFAAWIGNLSADDYATRQSAARRLLLRRDAAAPALRAALADPDLPPEARSRIERILDPAQDRGGPQRLRQAIQILRLVDDEPATALLNDLAGR